jgi:hypothetical protein
VLHASPLTLSALQIVFAIPVTRIDY